MCGVSATAGRRFWQTRTLSLDQEDWDRLCSGLQPAERAERNELFPALRRAVDEDLSGEQRTVFTAARSTACRRAAAALGSNRNAIYKALFEARRILRARLAAIGRDLAYRPGTLRTGGPWLDELLAADPGIRGAIQRSTYWTATPKLSSGERAPKAGSREWPCTCAAAKPAIRITGGCWPR